MTLDEWILVLAGGNLCVQAFRTNSKLDNFGYYWTIFIISLGTNLLDLSRVKTENNSTIWTIVSTISCVICAWVLRAIFMKDTDK